MNCRKNWQKNVLGRKRNMWTKVGKRLVCSIIRQKAWEIEAEGGFYSRCPSQSVFADIYFLIWSNSLVRPVEQVLSSMFYRTLYIVSGNLGSEVVPRLWTCVKCSFYSTSLLRPQLALCCPCRRLTIMYPCLPSTSSSSHLRIYLFGCLNTLISRGIG